MNTALLVLSPQGTFCLHPVSSNRLHMSFLSPFSCSISPWRFVQYLLMLLILSAALRLRCCSTLVAVSTSSSHALSTPVLLCRILCSGFCSAALCPTFGCSSYVFVTSASTLSRRTCRCSLSSFPCTSLLRFIQKLLT